jgi:cyanophycinase
MQKHTSSFSKSEESTQREQSFHLFTISWVPIYQRNCKEGVKRDLYIKLVQAADAVFFSGGKSGHLQKCLFGDTHNQTEVTPILKAIHEKEVVGGTSAGGMVQPTSNIMITGKTCESYECVSERNVYHDTDGFNLFNNGLVDVHYAERGRQGRLYVLAWQTKAKWAYGVDENTALVERPDRSMQVYGRSGVLVYEVRQNFTKFEDGLFVHFLTNGDVIDVNGTITWAAGKKKCSTDKPPSHSKSIFSEFRTKSIQAAQYSDPNYEYLGHVGSSPVVQVALKRGEATEAVCGEESQIHMTTSFKNLHMSVSTKHFDELGFFGDHPGPSRYENDD